MKLILGNRALAGGVDCEEEPFAVSLEVIGVVQIANTLRGISAEPIDRGNRRTELQFSVLRRHTSVSAATDYLFCHGASLYDLAGTATLIGEGQSQTAFTLSNAVLRSVRGVQDGATTTHTYIIVGGSLSPESEIN
ncbi:MAG: hypothetical protein LBB38_01040 [Puniceicoccales bacterium]|jgi:hypothetical protein|nr:hypothetical protein [Puniceicoccales bacterium]